jgi:cob(I)alamin adenosyltransferase
MAESKFDSPRIALNRIYTKAGDRGQTHLAGGQRIAKDALRIECYGTVDELNAFVGMAGISSADSVPELAAILKRIQHELFNLGSILATKPQDVHPKQARITSAEIARLEAEIDRMNADLAPLRSFVLPGGSRLNTELHACRTICRRAERIAVSLAREEEIPPEIIQYLNRLSDAFFVWSRWASHVLGVPEVLWEPNQ